MSARDDIDLRFEHAVSKRMFALVRAELFACFRDIEGLIPPPRPVETMKGWTYRFVERLPHQIILAKLSRVITGIQSQWVLLNAGFVQESWAIQRMLDELDTDITFVAGPLLFGDKEPAHDDYLNDFFQEEFEDGKSAVQSSQRRRTVPRRKIRSYNARKMLGVAEVEKVVAVLETIDKTYSGFIHSAGVHVMDSYGGIPPRFHIEGMRGTSRQAEGLADFRNYLHRSLIASAMAAKALGAEEVFCRVRDRSDSIGMQFAMIDTWPHSDVTLAALRRV